MNYKIIATTFEIKRSGRILVLPTNDLQKAISLIPADMEITGAYIDIFNKYVEPLTDTLQIKQIFEILHPWITDDFYKNEFCFRVAETILCKFKNEMPDKNIIEIIKTCTNYINYGGYLTNLDDLIPNNAFKALYRSWTNVIWD